MPAVVRVKVPAELATLTARLKDVDTSLARGTALKAFAPKLDRALKMNSQPPNGGGGFARGWMVSLLPSGKGLAIVNLFGKAKFVEYDTPPHVILPKRKKLLAWRVEGKAPFSAFKVNAATKKGAFIFAGKVNHPGTKGKGVFKGAFIFAGKVNHPGTTGKGVFARTIQQTAPQLFQMLTAELKKLLA